MNLALLFEEDFITPDRARLRGRRLDHLKAVLNAGTGHRIPVGRVNGLMGYGEVLSLSSTEAELQLTLDQNPPPPLPLTLILAMAPAQDVPAGASNRSITGCKRHLANQQLQGRKEFLANALAFRGPPERKPVPWA